LVNKTNFNEYLYLLDKANFLILSNSSSNHFANYTYKKKILTFFFGTHHPKEWSNMNKNCINIFSDLKCSPCHLSLNKECPYNKECHTIYSENFLNNTLKNFLS
jgi:ADP-heptose:LPS heptosyltransferase